IPTCRRSSCAPSIAPSTPRADWSCVSGGSSASRRSLRTPRRSEGSSGVSAAPGDFAVGRRLPSRPALLAGQALDSYLEHLAEANHLRPADLSRLITATTDTVRFLMLTPSARMLTALSALTGLPREQLRAATLAQYDGTVLDLTGLEHH